MLILYVNLPNSRTDSVTNSAYCVCSTASLPAARVGDGVGGPETPHRPTPGPHFGGGCPHVRAGPRQIGGARVPHTSGQKP